VGQFENKGHRHNMEDRTVISHELRLNYKLNCSFYGVFDGHGSFDCVTFISENIIEKIRDFVINSVPLDQ
jgi:serine/threonine protein phosphatase PrpC